MASSTLYPEAGFSCPARTDRGSGHSIPATATIEITATNNFGTIAILPLADWCAAPGLAVPAPLSPRRLTPLGGRTKRKRDLADKIIVARIRRIGSIRSSGTPCSLLLLNERHHTDLRFRAIGRRRDAGGFVREKRLGGGRFLARK